MPAKRSAIAPPSEWPTIEVGPALYKINREKSAIENFREQLARQCGMVAESRHRLYLLELQLRQYEVGRSILLSQLAQAEKASPEAKCAAKRLVLPLDHGPRAQTTPYLNDRRKASFEAEQKACKDAAAKGSVR